MRGTAHGAALALAALHSSNAFRSNALTSKRTEGVDGNSCSFSLPGVQVGSSRKNLPKKENRLSAVIEMVGERGLEPPRITPLVPKST